MSYNYRRFLMSKSQSFSSFAALAAHLRASQHASDVARARNLKRSASIARKAPGTGPRVAH
jgi:hypothetical protein